MTICTKQWSMTATEPKPRFRGGKMVERLFVYGTLGPGRPNEHVLGNIGGSWEAASVTGTLREEGWGAAMGYPGIVLDKHGDVIRGFLFSSDKLADHWATLDEFEGEAYARVLTEVRLDGNRTADAYIYTLKTN
jgi:gamma-glutamylcyclotransferase (GGCT)/AIG2-like uncharacterized protein YtfP